MNIWKRISNTGITKGLDEEQKKRVKITNQITVSISLIASCYLFIFYVLGFKKEALGVVIIVSTIIAPLIFTYLRYYLLARMWLLLAINTAVYIYSNLFGEAAGIQLAYFSFVCIPWIIYDIKNWKYILIGVLIPVVCYIVFLSGDGKPAVDITQEAQRTIYLTLVIAVFLIITLSIMFFAYQSHQAEQFLQESNKVLKEHDAVLDMQNKQLKEIAWIQSHKMRKPVATIMGLIGLLKPEEQSLDPESKKAIEYIKTAADELDEVIAEINDKTKAVE